MLDADLAALYGVSTGALNQAVRRNRDRFPDDFMFHLNQQEAENLKSQLVTSSWGGRRKLPWAFTEHGVAMLVREQPRWQGSSQDGKGAAKMAREQPRWQGSSQDGKGAAGNLLQ